MRDDVTLQLSIRGQFQSGEFPDWICHRAGVLNLSGWVNAHDNGLIEVMVHGDEILVDAFELACSIGPYSVMVDNVESKPVVGVRPDHEFVRITTH